MADYYKVLGVSPQASEKEIKSAYRSLAKKYHPDTVQGNPELTEKMYEIQAAYEVLGDEEKRKRYEERRKAGATKAEKRKPDPDLSQFERFFGFQAGKGMETKKANGPINPEELFAAYFGKKK